MTTRDVYIRQYDWMLHLFLDVNPEYLYEVVTKMDDVAISSHIIRRVALLIKHSEYDYGLTGTINTLLAQNIDQYFCKCQE